MLSSSLPSGSALPLFMAYFLGTCGNQIWSHAHFFMFGLLTLFQSLLWNCALENSTEWQNYKMADAHTILLLHLLYSLGEFLQIHDLISSWRMIRYLRHHNKPTQIWERKRAHKVCWSPLTNTLSRTDGGLWALFWLLCEGRAGEEKVAS